MIVERLVLLVFGLLLVSAPCCFVGSQLNHLDSEQEIHFQETQPCRPSSTKCQMSLQPLDVSVFVKGMKVNKVFLQPKIARKFFKFPNKAGLTAVQPKSAGYQKSAKKVLQQR
jgi:hypothetical protein